MAVAQAFTAGSDIVSWFISNTRVNAQRNPGRMQELPIAVAITVYGVASEQTLHIAMGDTAVVGG